MSTVLLLDPAFRNFGWAVMTLGPVEDFICDVGVITTKKADKKQRLYVSDDNHTCSTHIAQQLQSIVATYCPIFICAEAQQGSKSSKAIQMQGMAWGILSAVAAVNRVPVLQAQPQQVKKALTQRNDASKEEIEAVVCKHYTDLAERVKIIKPKSLHEHIYDACAVGIACLNSTEIQTARRMMGR